MKTDDIDNIDNIDEINIEDFEMDITSTVMEGSGAFIESLKRSNSKIRGDRATAIAEDTKLIYNREIEDLYVEIKRLIRDRDNALDLSPTTADSLILASDFNSKEFVRKDLETAVKLRNLIIKYKMAKSRFNKLFV